MHLLLILALQIVVQTLGLEEDANLIIPQDALNESVYHGRKRKN